MHLPWKLCICNEGEKQGVKSHSSLRVAKTKNFKTQKISSPSLLAEFPACRSNDGAGWECVQDKTSVIQFTNTTAAAECSVRKTGYVLAHVAVQHWALIGLLHHFHMEAPNKIFSLCPLLLIPALNSQTNTTLHHTASSSFLCLPSMNPKPIHHSTLPFFPQHMLQAAQDLCSLSPGRRRRSSQISNNWHFVSTFLDIPCQHWHAALHCPLKGKQLCTASRDLLPQSNWHWNYITLMLGNFRLR